MDHHCVWLNNCVGCGNHRRFVGFVLCQLGYAALFLSVSTASMAKEISSEVRGHVDKSRAIFYNSFYFLHIIIPSYSPLTESLPSRKMLESAVTQKLALGFRGTVSLLYKGIPNTSRDCSVLYSNTANCCSLIFSPPFPPPRGSFSPHQFMMKA